MNTAENSNSEEHYERRAPGWRIRCLKCGFTEHWGKYGIRLGGHGRTWTIAWCSRCRWIHCHVIEKNETQVDNDNV